MNIENKYPVMIFKREYEGKTYYNVGLSRKDKDGNYINGYMSCRFKNGVEVADKTKIYIKNAWLDFYLKDKVTIPYIFINEFTTVEQAIDNSKKTDNEVLQQVMNEEPVNDPFEEFGQENQIELSNLDLPF